MAFCESGKFWTITLILDSDPSTDELLRLEVTEISASGIISGFVKVSDGEIMSKLSGRCTTPDQIGVPVARMSFIFRVRRAGRVWGVHLSGIAHPPEATPRFKGLLRTFVPDVNTPPSDGVGELKKLQLLADPGDTGTGNGSQT